MMTLVITLDEVEVTGPSTNSGQAFYRFASRATLSTNLPAGTHTWSASIADVAGNVTVVSNSFTATGAVNPNAP
jgi:hypothetical protein